MLAFGVRSVIWSVALVFVMTGVTGAAVQLRRLGRQRGELIRELAASRPE